MDGSKNSPAYDVGDLLDMDTKVESKCFGIDIAAEKAEPQGLPIIKVDGIELDVVVVGGSNETDSHCSGSIVGPGETASHGSLGSEPTTDNDPDLGVDIGNRETGGAPDTEAPPCQSCQFAGSKGVASRCMCEECGSLYLCRQCEKVHRKNKATEKHVIIPLERRAEATCKRHIQTINRFCGTCREPCCNLCVLLEHGDHAIQGVGEAFNAVYQAVASNTSVQESRSTDLKNFQEQLHTMSSSDVPKQRCVLFNEIDQHAGVCVAQILKQKETLKAQVEHNYRLVAQVTGHLQKVSTITKLDCALAKAREVIGAVEPHPTDIMRLYDINRELTNAGISSDIRAAELSTEYENLLSNPVHFVPTTPTFNIGALRAKDHLNDDYREINACKLIFEKRLSADDPTKVVPFVVNLGNNYYAVPHPCQDGLPADAIDVYKVPGEYQRTFEEDPGSVHDMAPCPDGNLAVLASGSKPGLHCVSLFHPVSGYIGSTPDIPTQNAISFDVNFCHQYVCLCNDGGRSISICNKDGSLEMSQRIDEAHGVKDASRIVCSRKYIYVLGRKRFAVYKCKDKALALVVTTENEFSTLTLTDISVTDFDEVTVCYEQAGTENEFWFGRCVLLRGDLSGWNIRVMRGQARRTRLSRNHDYMVTSQEGSTIRVYEESTA